MIWPLRLHAIRLALAGAILAAPLPVHALRIERPAPEPTEPHVVAAPSPSVAHLALLEGEVFLEQALGNDLRRIRVYDALPHTRLLPDVNLRESAAGPARRLGPSALAAPPPARVPAEFERQEALLVAAGKLNAVSPDTLTSLAAATRGRVALVGLVSDEDEHDAVSQSLAQRQLPPDSIRSVAVPLNTMWIRDYGPIFVKRGAERLLIDTGYGRFDRWEDENLPLGLAFAAGATMIRAPLMLHGGNFLSNGEGLCLTTTTLLAQNQQLGHDEAAIRRLLGQYFGVEQPVFLEPLAGEETGHVDMFACFVRPDTVVVGRYDSAVDPANARVLDRNAARLSSLTTARGKLRVVRIPMPPNDDGVFRTYTNGIFANGLLLMPAYSEVDPAGRQEALATFLRVLPGWDVATIDVGKIIESGGALRCISANVPAGGVVPSRIAARISPRQVRSQARPQAGAAP